jgi:hypothetical protein
MKCVTEKKVACRKGQPTLPPVAAPSLEQRAAIAGGIKATPAIAPMSYGFFHPAPAQKEKPVSREQYSSDETLI